MYTVTMKINEGIAGERTFKTKKAAIKQATLWFDTMNTVMSELCGDFRRRFTNRNGLMSYRFENAHVTLSRIKEAEVVSE